MQAAGNGLKMCHDSHGWKFMRALHAQNCGVLASSHTRAFQLVNRVSIPAPLSPAIWQSGMHLQELAAHSVWLIAG